MIFSNIEHIRKRKLGDYEQIFKAICISYVNTYSKEKTGHNLVLWGTFLTGVFAVSFAYTPWKKGSIATSKYTSLLLLGVGRASMALRRDCFLFVCLRLRDSPSAASLHKIIL